MSRSAWQHLAVTRAATMLLPFLKTLPSSGHSSTTSGFTSGSFSSHSPEHVGSATSLWARATQATKARAKHAALAVDRGLTLLLLILSLIPGHRDRILPQVMQISAPRIRNDYHILPQSMLPLSPSPLLLPLPLPLLLLSLSITISLHLATSAFPRHVPFNASLPQGESSGMAQAACSAVKEALREHGGSSPSLEM